MHTTYTSYLSYTTHRPGDGYGDDDEDERYLDPFFLAQMRCGSITVREFALSKDGLV